MVVVVVVGSRGRIASNVAVVEEEVEVGGICFIVRGA